MTNKSDYVKKFYDSLEKVLQKKQTSSSTPSTPSSASSASSPSSASSASSPSSAIPRDSFIVRRQIQQQAKKIQKERKIKQYINEEDQYVLKNDDTQVDKYNNVLQQRRRRPSRLANITGKHSFEFIPGIKNIKTPCKEPNSQKTCLNISSIKKLAKNSVQKKDEFEFEKLLLEYILGNDIRMDTTLMNMLKYRPSQRHIPQRSGILH